VLLGNSGVGKSNLIARYHSDEFSSEFMSTIGVEFVTKKVRMQHVAWGHQAFTAELMSTDCCYLL
jgi:putative ribosome biogenesis GTPase RsgA